MDDLNKAFNHLFGFKVPIDDYDEFEKKVEEAREIKEHLDKVEILKDIPQIITPVKMTNYDRIKSMSVEEMAEMLIEETEAPLSGEPFLRTPDGELFSEYEEQAKNKAILHTIQWLLQEVSDGE